MSILDYPEQECFSCHGNTWWYTTTNPAYRGPAEWKCGNCFPPTDEQTKLKMRVIKGTYLLNKIRYLPDTNKEDWIDGVTRLTGLVNQLNSNKCLYIEDGKKLKKCTPLPFGEQGLECFACRNEYWIYQELADIAKMKEEKEQLL